MEYWQSGLGPKPNTLIAESLPRLQRRLFERVEQAGKEGIRAEQLMIALYGDDPQGGPESRNVIPVMVYYVNKKIAKHGLAIKGNRPFGFYRLMPTRSRA